MAELVFIEEKSEEPIFPPQFMKGKRHLTFKEIEELKRGFNINSCPTWKNILVEEEEESFNPSLVRQTSFSGFVILGRIKRASLTYHDTVTECGLYNSYIKDCVLGDDNSVVNCNIINYQIGNRNILLNVKELLCTKHAKFGNGILKEGESEEVRIKIEVANENGKRAVLPYKDLLVSDAYLWAKYRGDTKLMECFQEMVEKEFSKECNTYGVIGSDNVLKNNVLIKDTYIYDYAYIKGAFKIKNVTIFSSKEEETQIGEGVELVNGIVQYGSRIFYQAIAVRFIIGRNCQLKYGARLLNSFLGENSTVSCCELLNNIIFPFHEQHHNSSFLISSIIMGQSNIAAGATIGSNHNSRSPNGELVARRGFWPGLCTSFKHNSKFASFVLVSKGAYNYELDIKYPFSLVTPSKMTDSPIHITPAWYFMSDMFAIIRNKYKFCQRDKRVVKTQNIETSPFAPDTIEECVMAVEHIITLTASSLHVLAPASAKMAKGEEELRQRAKDFLHIKEHKEFTLYDEEAQKRYGAALHKADKAYKMYRKIIKYFCASCVIEYCIKHNYKVFNKEVLEKIKEIPLYVDWNNIGGQVISSDKIKELFDKVKDNSITSWQEVHTFYNTCQDNYIEYKARYSVYLLEYLYSQSIDTFKKSTYLDILKDVLFVSNEIYESTLSSYTKDFTDPYRVMMYDDMKETEAVLGKVSDNSFLLKLKEETAIFNKRLKEVFRVVAEGE